MFQSSAHIIYILAIGLVADEDVLVVERDASSFLQSLVSLGGFAREYSHGVGKESGALLQLGINQSVAGAQQEYQHEDTPGNGKSRERSAELVALRRAPYFFD